METNKLKQKIESKYKSEFSTFNEGSFENNLLALLKDLINHSECEWDLFGIRYDTVMTKKEWTEFITHPERIPYRSKLTYIKDKPFNEVFEYIIELVREIYPYYKKLDDSEFKSDLKKNINSLLECSFNARYEDEEQKEADLYIGRNTEDRENGNINLTETSLNRWNRALNEYALYSNKNPTEIKARILKEVDNDLRKIGELLAACDIDKELRTDIVGINKILNRDYTLRFSDVKRAWVVWNYFREIGINVNGYLELLGLPDYVTVKRRLEDFMSNSLYVNELLKHFEDDLPESYKKYIANGFLDISEIRFENANRKKYPKKLRTDDEINKMIEEVHEEIFRLLPLSKEQTPRNVILNPTHPSSTNRAFNSTIKNKDGKTINTIVMTPRVDNKDDFLPTFAHEMTHALHRKILDLGESSGVLKKGASDSVSSAVLEDFSQLVDEQFKSDKDLPYNKSFKGNEFPNFWSGYVTRFQVPFSLCQLTLRKEFDDLYDSGFRGQLSEKYIWDLKNKLDRLEQDWYSTGINITNDTIGAFDLFSSYNPRDGVVYMKRYMMKENTVVNSSKIKTDAKEDDIKADNKEIILMPNAFRQKWGEEWIQSKDARIMLHWLLLETGRNENTQGFSEFIFNKPINECLEELAKIGLKEKDII